MWNSFESTIHRTVTSQFHIGRIVCLIVGRKPKDKLPLHY